MARCIIMPPAYNAQNDAARTQPLADRPARCSALEGVLVAIVASVFTGCRGLDPVGLRPDSRGVVMTTTTVSTGAELGTVDEPLFSPDKQAALTGFLADYPSRRAYRCRARASE